MKHTMRGISGAVALLVLMLAVAACGATGGSSANNAQPQVSIAATSSAAATTEQASDNIPSAVSAGGPGIDQTKIDVCALLPRPQLEAAIGALTKPPKQAIAIGAEVGCDYVVEQGRAYSVTVYNLDRWELLPTFLEVEPVGGLGDGAYLEHKGGSDTTLYVLLRDRAVVGVSVNGADTPQLRQLLDLALNSVRAYAA